MTSKTATLEVSAEQAEILLAAAATGQLALVLRAADDFGLSGIGDLSMFEDRAPEIETAAPSPDLEASAAGTNPESRQREVTIISAGISRVVTTATKEVR